MGTSVPSRLGRRQYQYFRCGGVLNRHRITVAETHRRVQLLLSSQRVAPRRTVVFHRPPKRNRQRRVHTSYTSTGVSRVAGRLGSSLFLPFAARFALHHFAAATVAIAARSTQ